MADHPHDPSTQILTPTSSEQTLPPHFVLISQSELSSSSGNQPQSPLSVSLSHPTIQYHYLDDPPLALLPISPEEQVLVLEYDPSPHAPPPMAKSLSRNVVVTGVKVADAPGAAGAEAGEKNVNDKIYVLETIVVGEDKTPVEASESDLRGPHPIISRFKQRNSILHHALNYPSSEKAETPLYSATQPHISVGPTTPTA